MALNYVEINYDEKGFDGTDILGGFRVRQTGSNTL